MTKLVVLIVVCIVVGELDAAATYEGTPKIENGAADEEAVERQGMAIAQATGPGPGQGRPIIPGQYAPGVECYVCTDCASVQPNTTSKFCPPTLDSMRQRTCVVYAEQYKHMKRPWVTRGCASERGTCADIRQAHALHTDIVSLSFCKDCTGDRCNTSSATRSIADASIAFLILIVMPVLGKITFS